LASDTIAETGAGQTRELDLNGARAVYLERGSGPTTVLVHGIGQDHGIWRAQQQGLDRRTVAYDVRGHGGSALGAADGSLAQLGEDLCGLLEQVGPATCVGFSLGGTIALWAAAERPELVTDVVAVATSSVVGSAASDFFRRRATLFDGGDRETIRAALREETETQLRRAPDRLEQTVDERLRAVGDGRGYANAARAMASLRSPGLNERLEQIGQPVKVVRAEFDELCPLRAAEIMLAHLGDAEVETIPDAGHLVPIEDPQGLTRVLSAWLERGRPSETSPSASARHLNPRRDERP
jgi:pimeloyl-ACP methyl ester carboxylesterase